MTDQFKLPEGAKPLQVGGGVWYPLKKPGVTIIGRFQGLRPRNDGQGEVADWLDDNKVPFTTPAPMILARTLADPAMKGQRLAVVYLGSEGTSGGKRMSQFSVGLMPAATKENHWLLRDHMPESAVSAPEGELPGGDDDLPF